MRFVASSSGMITGIRYYKTAGDTGAHTGSLWTSAGTLVATVSFADSGSVSGWQTATFTNPVHIAAGTTYVAAVHTTGAYVATGNYFANAVTSGPLTLTTRPVCVGIGRPLLSCNLPLRPRGANVMSEA